MSNVQKPDIADALSIQGGNIGADTSAIQGSEAQLGVIRNDWGAAQAGLQSLASGPEAVLQQRADGNNLTGGYWANRQAETANALQQPQSMGDLGRFLLASAKGGNLQAAQATRANVAQQQAAAEQVSQIQNNIFQSKQSMQQANMNLSNQKFSIWQTLNNANNSMQNAQATLHNNYVNGLAQANNAAQAIALQQSQYNINQDLSYIGASLGAASSATAGWAASASQAAPATAAGPSGAVAGLMTQYQTGGYAVPGAKVGA